MTTKSKLKDSFSEPEDKTKPKPFDWMSKWSKEEKCYRDAILRDVNTKKVIEGGWPRQKPTAQQAYENWRSAVINQDTGQWYEEAEIPIPEPELDENGVPIPIEIPVRHTEARYVINVITRFRDQTSKKEYLASKGSLIGYDAGGMEKRYPARYPEIWDKTEFVHSRTYDEKTGAYTVQTTGPSRTYQIYELPFSADNVRKLFEKVENDNVMFVLKDLKTGDAREVKWSSVKDSLDLFCNKSFEYLWKADYIPLPVKMEYRQEAVAAGIIKGVASDYQMQSSTQSTIGVE